MRSILFVKIGGFCVWPGGLYVTVGFRIRENTSKTISIMGKEVDVVDEHK